jgi:undecaprenyl-diphosphatase
VPSLPDLHRRATSRREPQPPLALTHPVGARHVWGWLLAIAATLVVALWVVETWLIGSPLPALDAQGVQWASDQRGPRTIAVARVLTHLGDVSVVAAVSAALVVLARYRSGRWDSAKLVVVAVGGALLVTGAAKELTGRLRPDEALTSTVSLAFPSGHASRAAVVYLLVAWISVQWAKHPVTRHVVPVLAVGMVAATSWSRVLLGAHWPTDVVAGIALGAIWLVSVIALTRPVPVARSAPAAATREGTDTPAETAGAGRRPGPS